MMKFRLRSTAITLLMALHFLCVLNITLVVRIYHNLDALTHVDAGFAASVPVFFLAGFYLFFLLFSGRFVQKPAAIFLLLTAPPISYSMYHYGIVFDVDMIQNFAETNYAEATSYINLASISWYVSTGLMPAIFLCFCDISRRPFYAELLHKMATAGVAIACIGVIALFYYRDYVSVGRNDHAMRKVVVPTYYLYSAYKYIRRTYFSTPMPYKLVAQDAYEEYGVPGKRRKFTVLVVGETARAQNYELNGYTRPTNQYTKGIANLVYFRHASSCGTATAVSVPCMFSVAGREEFSSVREPHQDNVLDIVQRVGDEVVWLENNSSCKGVCQHIPTIDVREAYSGRAEYCYEGDCGSGTMLDSVLLEALNEQIENARQDDKDHVVVLHIMGSHGPTYFQRYPKEFEKFTPGCNRSDIQNCSEMEIINSYDNTILYTDFILSQVIARLEREGDRWDSMMLYASDHGESLGEHGLYLHGLPYSIAPDTQTHIPLILWFSEKFLAREGLDMECLKAQAETLEVSHDNLFNTLLNLLDISTSSYNERYDMLSSCEGSQNAPPI